MTTLPALNQWDATLYLDIYRAAGPLLEQV
jgi:hypothetical protein